MGGEGSVGLTDGVAFNWLDVQVRVAISKCKVSERVITDMLNWTASHSI